MALTCLATELCNIVGFFLSLWILNNPKKKLNEIGVFFCAAHDYHVIKFTKVTKAIYIIFLRTLITRVLLF